MIGHWVVVVISILVVLTVCGIWLYLARDACLPSRKEMLHTILSIATCAVLIAGILLFAGWWRNETESGKRMLKSWESETSAGIQRTVRVFDIHGVLLATYAGKFDLIHDSERILFDDEDGRRHIIYFTTGTIIIDEE